MARYPHTPIRIIEGETYAWLWNGRDRDIRRLPIYRLGKPRIGHSKNGRLLTYPTRGQHIMIMEKR
jgi:hypothetical protein